MGIIPNTDVPATDDVIDAIADIEMKRRETERTAGFPMSCSAALHRLNELLEHEAEALRLRGPDVGNPGNLEAVKSEIGRVKGLTVPPKSPNAFPNNAHTGQGQAAWRSAARNPARNKGRRTMGRDGGR